MTRPTTKYLSTVNYQRPCLLNIRFLPLNSRQFSFAVSSVTVNVITFFSHWRPWQAHFEPGFISLAVHSPCYKASSFSLSPFFFFFPLPFLAVHCCIRFPHVANDCAGKGIFCFNLTFSQGRTKKRGTSFLQLVSLRKLFRIASFQGRLANAYNPRLSAIVHHNLAIILCLFHLENPYPIKVIQPFQYLLPIKSGRYYLPW